MREVKLYHVSHIDYGWDFYCWAHTPAKAKHRVWLELGRGDFRLLLGFYVIRSHWLERTMLTPREERDRRILCHKEVLEHSAQVTEA